MKTVKFTPQEIKKIIKKVELPFKQAKNFFILLRNKVDQHTQLTFRLQGARSGNSAWPSFSPKTLKTSKGTPQIRYGTDLSAKWPNNIGRKAPKNYPGYGPIRKGIRRYNSQSKLLQASGTFRKSFGKIGATRRDRLVYGTMFPLAKKIMSNPNRPVLFITGKDYMEYGNLFMKYVKDNIKI